MAIPADRPHPDALNPDLVGRRAELARAQNALDVAASGRPVALLIEGVIGIGKTTVLNAVAEMALVSGFHVGRAAASGLEKELPFTVMRQLFEDVLSATDTESILEAAGPLARAALGGGAADPLDDYEEMALHQTFQGLHRLIAALTERAPLCLAVDDLQWVDVPTLRWLNYLVRRTVRLPLLVVMSRTSGVYPDDPLLVAELDIYAERIKLGGFTDDDVATYTERMLGRPAAAEFAATSVEVTGGNPFVLRQVLTSMRHSATPPDEYAAHRLSQFDPEELGASVLARLNRQSSRLVRLARVIAVLSPCDLDLAAAVAEMSLPEAADGVRQLAVMGLLAEDERLTFSHTVVQSAVISAISHIQRDEIHAKAALCLRDRQAPDLAVAKHVQRTTRRLGAWAAETLRRASDTSVTDGDPVSGASFLSRALREDIPTELRKDLLTRLGLAETYFDPHQAVVHLEEAMENLDDPASVFKVAYRLAQVLYLDARPDEARDMLRRAIEKIEPIDQGIAKQLRLALRVTVPMQREERDRLDSVEPADLDSARREGGARGRTLAALVAEVASNTGEDIELSRKAALTALSGGVGPIMHDPQRLVATIDALIRADEFDLALRYCTQTTIEAKRQGLVLLSVLGHTMRSRVYRQCGSLTEAIADARLAVTGAQDAKVHARHFSFVYTTEALIRALLHLGDLDAAQAAIEPIGLVGTLPRSWHHACLLHTRGILRMQLGDIEGALADQLECGERLTSWGAPNPAHRSWRSYAAIAHLKLGRKEEALNLASEELELARRWKAPSSLARALLTVGMVTDRGGPGALPWLLEAVAAVSRSPARLLSTQVWLELGLTRWRIGQHEAAREDLAQARLLAEQCGVVPVLDALAKLPTDAVGPAEPVPARTLPSASVLPLTPHEYRVAGLVAAGNSNDEIAQKLNVSRRAIEFHLTNIYRKLGVRRRTQLSAALAAFSGED